MSKPKKFTNDARARFLMRPGVQIVRFSAEPGYPPWSVVNRLGRSVSCEKTKNAAIDAAIRKYKK